MVQLSTVLYAIIAGVVGVFIYTKLNSPNRRKAKVYKAPDASTIPKVKKDKDTVLYSPDPEQGRTVFLASRGYGGRPATTVVATFEKGVKKNGTATAFTWEEKEKGGNDFVWKTMTYREYYETSKRAARSLIKIGLPRYGGVSIIGFNSPEWIISHMATIMAGGLSAGIYTTNKTDSCKYIVNHSQSAVIVCEDVGQLNKFVKIANEMETVKAIVVYKEKNLDEHKKNFNFPILTWKEFLDFGTEEEQKTLEERISHQKPAHACSLIYTSGTTGPPSMNPFCA
jgi:long-chain-fatty-acid--CoA ligase ACSBG